jgi:Lrp/AsnC family transcriptional regulator for asnA, asnC and gidA
MYETDKVDLQIIDLLMEDGRIPAAEIARRVGRISERAVRYRIDRMVTDGLIKISAIVNPKLFGYPIVADVVIEMETGQINEVVQKLAAYECVSYVACSIGEMDVSVQVVAKDTGEVYRFSTEVIGKMPGVRKTTTSIVPIVLKDVYQWRIPREKGSKTKTE